ncbi:MFS transporter [Pseudomonas syringae pv. actinidifoliorum]|uniref:MFS transporter n=1 Tax=Pseudomonas syringae TaxID=317 RepID=UPI001373676F|nr:MFS transporter [Pseudomonas syringae]NAS97679.1 MFS transporter [Pseudomonas syringae pv. actinidifoliorum]NAT64331.1 MFS transporter [Pseudomonas syringae pv. actinidifoliorum]
MHTPAPTNLLCDVVDNRPVSRLLYEVIALCVLVALLDGFDTQIIGFLVTAISSTLGVTPQALAPVFAVGLFGLMLGALLLAPMADRLGRKKILVVSILLFGTFAALTALATSVPQLLVVRFLTGIGLGGAIPNLVALISEYSPRRYSRSAVTLLFCGMPLGAMLAGLTVDQLLHILGWQNLFLIGGALPLLVAGAVVWRLPESVEFLSRKPGNRDAVKAIIQRLAPELTELPASIARARPGVAASTSLSRLFTGGMWRRTLLLWLPYAMNLLILYFIMSWIPTVLVAAHAPLSLGIRAIILFSLGGVIGSVIQGAMMNRWGAANVLTTEFAGYLAIVLALSQLPVSLYSLFPAMLMLGVLVQGAQAGLNALAAELYPQEIRSTGVGWALGVGRVGSIAGPLFGGLMLAAGWVLTEILSAALIPGFIALAAMTLLRFEPSSKDHPAISSSVPHP